MDSKDAFDAFFASKMTTPTEEKPVEEAKAGEEVEPEKPEPAEKLAEETPKAEGEEKPSEDEEKLEKVNPRIREILKGVDSKVRKEFVDNYFIGKSYRESGMPLGDIPEYLRIAPTREVLQDLAGMAKVAGEMLSDFNDPKEGVGRFVQRLYQTNQQSFRSLVQSVSDPDWLQAAMPDVFTPIAQLGTYNALATLGERAKAANNEDLSTAVAIIAEELGLDVDEKALASRRAAQPQQQRSPQDEEAYRRLQELEQRDAQLRQNAYQSFAKAAYDEAAGAVTTKIDEVIASSDPDNTFNQKTREKMKTQIGEALVKSVSTNETVMRKLNALMANGDGSPEHKARVSQYLITQATALLPMAAKGVVEDYSSLFDNVKFKREEKVERVTSRREVGAGGKASPGTPPAPFSPKGMNMKDAFDAFFAHKQSMQR